VVGTSRSGDYRAALEDMSSLADLPVMSVFREVQDKRAGRSALARYHAQRRKAIRQNWLDWLGLTTVSVACVAAIVLFDGPGQLIAAGVLGAALMMGLVGWVVGDVHSLPWLWGAVGEQETAAALKRLDGSWSCEHDLQREHSNWDHVAIGRAGVFLIDTKRVSRPALAANDMLASGRIRSNGAAFRAAAADLATELERRCGTKPWVQAVVAIWGDFPQRLHEENRVTYLHADELVGWLVERPSRLSGESTRRLSLALRQIAVDRREAPVAASP
jgi:hypothetical protein